MKGDEKVWERVGLNGTEWHGMEWVGAEWTVRKGWESKGGMVWMGWDGIGWGRIKLDVVDQYTHMEK